MHPSIIVEAIACAGAAGMGYATAGLLGRRRAEKKRKALAKGPDADALVADRMKLECGGVAKRIILCAVMESIRPSPSPSVSLFGMTKRLGAARAFDPLVLKAGLKTTITLRGFESSRIRLTVAFLCIGAMLGSVLSLELAVLLALAGTAFGWSALPRALKAEARARSERLGYQLGEMAEVVALGLRSGLSFDRALLLYCEHFDSVLAIDCGQAHQQWTLGLVSREAALRSLAESYDSPLLVRVVESIVRSLRYGASLADTLESSAAEARSVHRAEVEERVAKAPVKMLIPVGTLILPAMLIFVLGPIMIDLMNGM